MGPRPEIGGGDFDLSRRPAFEVRKFKRQNVLVVGRGDFNFQNLPVKSSLPCLSWRFFFVFFEALTYHQVPPARLTSSRSARIRRNAGPRRRRLSSSSIAPAAGRVCLHRDLPPPGTTPTLTPTLTPPKIIHVLLSVSKHLSCVQRNLAQSAIFSSQINCQNSSSFLQL